MCRVNTRRCLRVKTLHSSRIHIWHSHSYIRVDKIDIHISWSSACLYNSHVDGDKRHTRTTASHILALQNRLHARRVLQCRSLPEMICNAHPPAHTHLRRRFLLPEYEAVNHWKHKRTSTYDHVDTRTSPSIYVLRLVYGFSSVVYRSPRAE